MVLLSGPPEIMMRLTHGWPACPGLMERTVIFVLLILAPTQGTSAGSGPLIPDEQRLYERIMGNYVRAVKPVVRSDLPLQVLFSIRLKQIVDLDERQQVLTTNVFIDQTWIDSALAWNASEFSDVTSLRIPADQIWKPDTFIYNNADNGSTGFVSGKFIQIRHNGAVTWPVPVRLRSSCLVKIAYFPFDYQRCYVRFGSWIYSHEFMDYKIRPDAVSVDLATYVNNSEWELLSMTMEKDTNVRARSSNIHPFLTMTIYLRRNTFFYLFNIIVPCIMLSMLTLMTFWLPPTSGEKVTLGLSVFLAFSMFMLLIAEEVPASSDAVPIMGIYLCVVMTMTSLSVILAVLATNLHYRGTKLRSAPRWFARLFIRVLALPFCVSRDVELLATTIILPDHCRFFLIHNKFDFPNYNINAYNQYNKSRQRSNSSPARSPTRRKQKHNKNSRIGTLDESQRYVFDQQDSQGKWNSHRYTSGKRRHAANRGENMTDSTPQNIRFGEAKTEYTNVCNFTSSDEQLETCNSETEIDDGGRPKKDDAHHSHCSLQHLCDSVTSPRKRISPFIDKLFLNARKSKRHNLNHDSSNNSTKTNALPSSEGCHTNDNASFTEEDSKVHVVSVDMTPAGATIDRTFPFMTLSPPSSFIITPDQYTSPNKRRRQLIKTMKDFNETKDTSFQTTNSFHLNVSNEDISQTNSCLSIDSSRTHHNRLKPHKHSKKKDTIRETAHLPLGDCSMSMNDLHLQENALRSRSRKFSSENVSKTYRNRKLKNVTSISSSCMIFNTNTPFEAQSIDHLPHSPSNRSQNRRLFHSPNSHVNISSSSSTPTKHSSSAKLCPLPLTDALLVADDTFCQCSDSQEDVWVPYDENNDAVWCLRDDFRRSVDYSPFDKEYSGSEDDTRSPLIPHGVANGNNNNVNTSSRRAKKHKSLSQQSVEQFMDERSRLILAKARLIMAEWQTIAAVIDRLLFLVALFATIFAYVFLLVIVPNDHNLDSFNVSQILPTSTGRYDWMAT